MRPGRASCGWLGSFLPSHRTHARGQRRPEPGPSHVSRRIVIPAATLAEFHAGAVASHGSLRRAAAGIGIPYSTLRGWLRRRGGDAGDHGEAFRSALTALRGHLDAANQHLTALLGDVNAMGRHLEVLEGDPRAQG